MKKQKQLFSKSTLFVELISILANASMYFNYDFDLSFLYGHAQKTDRIVNIPIVSYLFVIKFVSIIY